MSTVNQLLPKDFTYLKNIDSSILQSVRYASSENFVGYPLVGYNAKEIITTTACAHALMKVQKDVVAQGLSLVIYDAYRPQKTVNYFSDIWRFQPDNSKSKNEYYPTLTKSLLFNNHYIARQSSHSRGSTVDLTLINKDSVLSSSITRQQLTLSNGESIGYLNDGTIDMGTSFDMFHPASHHGSELIQSQQAANREILLRLMKQYGFKEHPEEWWHYTLIPEPFPDTYFDFDIVDLI